MEIDRALRNFLTGVERQRPPTNRATLAAARQAYGTWNNVAQQLGMSARTLRRVRVGLVSPRSQRAITDLASDPQVRWASMTSAARRRIQDLGGRSTKVTIQGSQGPVGKGRRDYRRDRTIVFDIDGGTMRGIADAFFAGDDAGAIEAFQNALEAGYGNEQIRSGGWEVSSNAKFTIR